MRLDMLCEPIVSRPDDEAPDYWSVNVSGISVRVDTDTAREVRHAMHAQLPYVQITDLHGGYTMISVPAIWYVTEITKEWRLRDLAFHYSLRAEEKANTPPEWAE